jgi:hypothetical protein
MVTHAFTLDQVRQLADDVRKKAIVRFGTAKEMDHALSLAVNGMEHIRKIEFLRSLVTVWLKGTDDPAFGLVREILKEYCGDPARETLTFACEILFDTRATLTLYRYRNNGGTRSQESIFAVSGPHDAINLYLDALITDEWREWKTGSNRLNSAFTLKKDDKPG